MELKRRPEDKGFRDEDRSRSNIAGARPGTENIQTEKETEEPSDTFPARNQRDAMKTSRTDINLQEALFPQPETRPITEEQLVNEVKAIYAGLVMVERKCVEIEKQSFDDAEKLTDLQRQALIALHRTLLHEHHAFILACDHHPVRKRSDGKYSMPARMWRYGINSFSELLRKGPPDPWDHMLMFIYLAYSMIAMLLKAVSVFEGIWIECLVYLSAQGWYDQLRVGRKQHHLAVLARPNMLQYLSCFLGSLVNIQTFVETWDSILLLFNPLLNSTNTMNKYYPPLLIVFFEMNGPLISTHDIATFIQDANLPKRLAGQVKTLSRHVIAVHLQAMKHLKQRLWTAYHHIYRCLSCKDMFGAKSAFDSHIRAYLSQ